MPVTTSARPPRPWAIAPLLVLVVAFVTFASPPYLTLDPAQSRIPLTSSFRPYYSFLVGHVIFGSVAILSCCLQVWPWFRARYPAAHRVVGRVYVFGGVLPAGGLGLVIGALTPFGPTLRASNILLAIVWLSVTLAGFRAAQQYRVVEHRRWMIRSVVLTLSIISNRLWAVVWVLTLSPQLGTTFGGNEALMIQTIAGVSGWLGWVLPLLVTEWWLETRGLPARPAGVPAGVSVGAPVV
ncbi:MAG: DUF2306 domain-containing protein [Vicinamibacterales bacterium]